MSASPASSATQPLRGVLLLASAVFFFACSDVTTKLLTTSYSVPLVAAVRYGVNLLLLLAILAPSQGRHIAGTQRTGLVLLRGTSLVAATLFFGLALQRMPVAETVAILFLAPILVVLVAGRVLGERIGAAGWVSAASGFAGVLLIVRPESGLDPVGVVSALGATAATVVYMLLSRLLVSTERTSALLFHTALVGSVCSGATLPWSWGGPAPEPWQVALLLSLGAGTLLGHFLLTAAFRLAPASLLAPVNYLQLVWAGLLGWLVFGHVPDGMTGLGMAVVAASGILVAVRSRRAPA